MRIAFSTLPAAGHMNPMTTLARKVRERGHEVFFVGTPDCEPYVRPSGLDFYVCAEERCPVGSSKEWEAELAKLQGMAALRFTIHKLMEALDVSVIDSPIALRAAGAEAIVNDEVGRGAFLAAAQTHLPLIHVANALPLHQYDSVPPPFCGWPYRPGWLGRLRNRLGYAGFSYVTRAYRTALIEHSRRLGVPFDESDPNAGLSRLARISQMPATFDFPNAELPSWFHHTGPFHDGLGRPEADFPWDRLSGRPLIYASMGTLQNGAERVFRTIAEGCANLDCQLVLSIGGNIEPESLGPLPGECIAVPYAPQLELLQRAALCITHAGMNTALESLAAGVPMVAIPVTNDQPAVAARIAHTRTGVVIPFKRLTAGRLRAAVNEVLANKSYQENARHQQAEIRAANGLERAADIIEEALRTGSRLS